METTSSKTFLVASYFINVVCVSQLKFNVVAVHERSSIKRKLKLLFLVLRNKVKTVDKNSIRDILSTLLNSCRSQSTKRYEEMH